MIILNANRKEPIEIEIEEEIYKINFVDDKKYREIVRACTEEKDGKTIINIEKGVIEHLKVAVNDWPFYEQVKKNGKVETRKLPVADEYLKPIIEEFGIITDRICAESRRASNWTKIDIKKKLEN